MWNLIYDTDELICLTETGSQTQRKDLWLPRRMVVGRAGLGVWDWQIQDIKYRMNKQQGPTV